jgi:hypothetical protein
MRVEHKLLRERLALLTPLVVRLKNDSHSLITFYFSLNLEPTCKHNIKVLFLINKFIISSDLII